MSEFKATYQAATIAALTAGVDCDSEYRAVIPPISLLSSTYRASRALTNLGAMITAGPATRPAIIWLAP